MSVAIIPNEGELILGGFIRSALNGTLKLFQSNTTPSQSTVLADLTEATFSGYAGIALATADFAAMSTVSNKAQIIASAFSTFTHSGGGTANTVYGYYFEQSGKILAAERFDSSIVMNDATDAISIKLKLTADSEN